MRGGRWEGGDERTENGQREIKWRKKAGLGARMEMRRDMKGGSWEKRWEYKIIKLNLGWYKRRVAVHSISSVPVTS